MHSRHSFLLNKPIILALVLVTASLGQGYLPDISVDQPPIMYFDRTLNTPIERLTGQIKRGKTNLEFRGDGLGYLPSLLDQLGVRADSQALVFSKTSFQAEKISRQNPRAIYFSDDVAVAFVRGSDNIEIAAVDPVLGPVFYTANIKKPDGPDFTRSKVCLKCHQGPATSGVPGLFVGSVISDPTGTALRGTSAIITDHRTPFEDRWGGWYVTAKSGEQQDRANAVASNPATPEMLDQEPPNRTELLGKFNPSGYLAPSSDIVALMTLEHQTQMMNYITRVGWEARIAQQNGNTSASARAQLDSDIEALVAYMLFVQEVRLREPIRGVSTFSQTFQRRGPRDRRGRSLRDFDLRTRLFRYPLSYMVYSAAFDGLPDEARTRIYRRLFEVLTYKDQSHKFNNLSPTDRRNILEILGDTKAGLPNYWRAG
jgi:hypothetical protein